MQDPATDLNLHKYLMDLKLFQDIIFGPEKPDFLILVFKM